MADETGGPEIVIGIPSYMEADGIGFVASVVDEGLSRHFPRSRALIVNADNASPDGTGKAFMAVETGTAKKYLPTKKGVTGKGSNIINLLRHSLKSGTPRCVTVVDADLRSITPEWIKYLVEPVMKGYDYVMPRYSRHQFDGTITNHICYPLIYGLLGEDIRQPIGGDFSMSGRFAVHLASVKWPASARLYGVDIFMTMNAVMGGFRICETGLGAKVHKASAPKLGPMFTQVVETFFSMVLSRKADWLGLPSGNPAQKPQFGLKRPDPPQELSIDIRDLKEKLRTEFFSREKLLGRYLSDYLYTRISRMVDRDHFDLDILTWTQAVYQLLFSYDNGSPAARAEIIEALKPLYFARSVSFDYETWKYRHDYAEELIVDQAKAFASQKPYFYGLYLKAAHDADRRIK
ncbi:MAG: glycosyltransferase [Spirochaetes bacterium]|jgi:glycosyltransferase involved in cell wall biosynthesis|nr:glycosyltransferase [Spirochaetota bacterium]